MISDVDGKANIIADFVERYKAVDPSVTINLNVVGYDVIREQLPIQLEAGTGPDAAGLRQRVLVDNPARLYGFV